MDRKFTFILFGIILWLAGVVMIRLLHPIIFGDPLLHSLLFVFAFLLAPLTLIPAAKITGRTKHDMLVPSAIMAMPSMLMDGLATTLDAAGKTYIYADTPVDAAWSGGLLLVAFWSIFFFALMWHREKA